MTASCYRIPVSTSFNSATLVESSIHTHKGRQMAGILTTSYPCIRLSFPCRHWGNSKYRNKDSASWCCSTIRTSITQTSSVALLVTYRYSCDRNHELVLPPLYPTIGFQNTSRTHVYDINRIQSLAIPQQHEHTNINGEMYPTALD